MYMYIAHRPEAVERRPVDEDEVVGRPGRARAHKPSDDGRSKNRTAYLHSAEMRAREIEQEIAC